MDGNGREGVAEALHALQVAAGLEPDSSSPVGTAQPNQVLSGVTFSNDNESGLVGEYDARTGTAQPDQVLSGVTFSNENQSSLVGEYLGPRGCLENGGWDADDCIGKCLDHFDFGTLDFSDCYSNWCQKVDNDPDLKVWVIEHICK